MDSTQKDREGTAEHTAGGSGIQTVVELSESEPMAIDIKGEKKCVSGATPSCLSSPKPISLSINPIQSTAPPDVDAPMKQARRSFPAAFKLLAIDHIKQGNSRKDTAGLFGVSVKLVGHWLQHEKQLRSSPAGKRKLKPPNRKKTSAAVAREKANSATLLPAPAVQWNTGTQLSPLVQALQDLVHTKGADLPLEPLPPISPVPPSTSTSSKVRQDNNTSEPSGGRGPPKVQEQPLFPILQPASSVPFHNLPSPRTRSTNVMAQPSRSTRHILPSVQRVGRRGQPSATVRPLSSLITTATGSPEENVTLLKTLSEGAVGQLLEAMNLSKYKKKFGEEQIDGELLTSLGETELRELGVESSLHRLRLKKLALGVYSPEALLKKRTK